MRWFGCQSAGTPISTISNPVCGIRESAATRRKMMAALSETGLRKSRRREGGSVKPLRLLAKEKQTLGIAEGSYGYQADAPPLKFFEL